MKKTPHLRLKILLAIGTVGFLFLVYLDALVSTNFRDRRWEMPARVYARPLELYAGRQLSPAQLDLELSLLGYRDAAQVQEPGQKRRAGATYDFHTRAFKFPDGEAISRPVRVLFRGDRIARLSSQGRGIDLLRLEPLQIGGIYPRHQEDRALLQLERVPRLLVEGLLAVEDQHFYEHWGVSLQGIIRAAIANIRAGRVVQGGSTVTQQLVKNYFLTNERRYWRKMVEAVMALLLELHFEKEEILEGYINEVFLGQDGPRAIHGFALASRYYFDAPLETLAIHQHALLIGMVKGASLYNPLRNPERALARRNTVLKVLHGEGILTEEEHAAARIRPLDLSLRPRIMNGFPAYLDLVRRQLRRDYREEDLSSLGLSIFTGFDPLLQHQAEQSIQTVLNEIDPSEALETALVVTSFDNGEVRALIGGRRPRFAGFNRAVDSVRPTGSLIKPAVFLAALQHSETWTLSTLLDDSPLTVENPGQPDWEPRNFDHQPHGMIPLYQALAQSYNLATARLGLALGIEHIQAQLRRLGVEREQPAVPSISLGAGGMSALDVTRLYQTIAAGGFRVPLRAIRDVVDADGRLLQRFPLEYDRVASLQAIHLLHYAMRDTVEEGTGKSLRRYLPEGFAVAGKTGTTNDYRDSWFAGFSGDLLAVSWVGRDDNEATGLTGAAGALRVWGHFMARASTASLDYRTPEGIEHFWIDEQSGGLSAKNCEHARLMPFIAGTQPQTRAPCINQANPVLQWFQKLL